MFTISKSEKSYIQAALTAAPPHRADGRGLFDYRTIALQTGVSPLANGSARVNIGVRTAPEGAGGTEVLAATKLEVEDITERQPAGRIVCAVSCSASAYPHLSSGALDDLSYDLTTLLDQTLSHPTLQPNNLGILPGRKAWVLHIDAIVVSDAGNVVDALFMAARSALWDTKVPRTRPVEYARVRDDRSARTGDADMDVDQPQGSVFETRVTKAEERAADFELPDFWDEGEVLDGRTRWPVPITMNLLPDTYFLDASLQEESSTALKLHLLFSFHSTNTAVLHAMRLAGNGEVNLTKIKTFITEGEKQARALSSALDHKLKEEDVRRGQKARAKFSGGR